MALLWAKLGAVFFFGVDGGDERGQGRIREGSGSTFLKDRASVPRCFADSRVRGDPAKEKARDQGVAIGVVGAVKEGTDEIGEGGCCGGESGNQSGVELRRSLEITGNFIADRGRRDVLEARRRLRRRACHEVRLEETDGSQNDAVEFLWSK